MIIIRFAKGLLARQQQQPLATDSSAKSRNANFCLFFFASFLLLSRALYLNIRNICVCNVFYCTSSHSTNAECAAEQTAFRRISICDFTCLNVTTRRSQLIPNSNTYSFALQLANAFQILHYPCRWSMFAVFLLGKLNDTTIPWQAMQSEFRIPEMTHETWQMHQIVNCERKFEYRFVEVRLSLKESTSVTMCQWHQRPKQLSITTNVIKCLQSYFRSIWRTCRDWYRFFSFFFSEHRLSPQGDAPHNNNRCEHQTRI